MGAPTKLDNAGTTVLVADDDADIRDLVCFRLEQAGYRVIPAADGREALELILEHRPEIAVLDVMMPHLDGLELTRRLRANEEMADLLIVLLSASTQDAAVYLGFEAGADEYVRKPFTPQQLLESLRALPALA